MKPGSPFASWRLVFTAGLLCAASTAAGHPGSLDVNGGHYQGPSYHCHLTQCEMPDTFGRLDQDGLFTDPRDREKFFNRDDWSYDEDFDGDCQTTRQEMLVLTSRIPVTYTNPRNCMVRIGEWLDEYTGKLFTVATEMDLDHVIPLIYAHSHGGDRWPSEKKLAFANDPLNLILVDKREIRRKNFAGPNRYLPRDEYQCQYARLWESIADKYNLDLETWDRSAVRRILRECPGGGGETAQESQN